MIVFSCSACGKNIKVKDELAGKKVKCPSCAGVAQVPAGAAAGAVAGAKPAAAAKSAPVAPKKPSPSPAAVAPPAKKAPAVKAPTPPKKPAAPPPDDDDDMSRFLDDEPPPAKPAKPAGKKPVAPVADDDDLASFLDEEPPPAKPAKPGAKKPAPPADDEDLEQFIDDDDMPKPKGKPGRAAKPIDDDDLGDDDIDAKRKTKDKAVKPVKRPSAVRLVFGLLLFLIGAAAAGFGGYTIFRDWDDFSKMEQLVEKAKADFATLEKALSAAGASSAIAQERAKLNLVTQLQEKAWNQFYVRCGVGGGGLVFFLFGLYLMMTYSSRKKRWRKQQKEMEVAGAADED